MKNGGFLLNGGSLLNVDNKIMTKVLAMKLEKVIGSLIYPNQSGFIKGRFIGEGIRFVENLIKYLENTGETGLLLQLDFEKAFDSVEWTFLIATLEKIWIWE